MWFDIDHACDELNWQPRFSNDEMLADSYDWFVANRRLATAGSIRVAAPPHAVVPAAHRHQVDQRPDPGLTDDHHAPVGIRRHGAACLRPCAAVVARADARGHQVVSVPRPAPAGERRDLDVRRPPVCRMGSPPDDCLRLAEWAVVRHRPGRRSPRLGCPPTVDRHDHARRRCRGRLGGAPVGSLRRGGDRRRARLPTVAISRPLCVADLVNAPAVGRTRLDHRADDRRGDTYAVAGRCAVRPRHRHRRSGQHDGDADDRSGAGAVARRRRRRAHGDRAHGARRGGAHRLAWRSGPLRGGWRCR